MDLFAFLGDPMAFGFMQRGLLASLLVGVVCAVIGTFVVLKGLAFIGDALSHATFPGLVIAYLVGAPIYLGAAVAAVATSLAIGFVSRRGRLRFDTSVGVLFAGTFALGVLLFSTIDSYVPDLLGYLLGNVLGITFGDLVQVALLGVLVLVTVLVIRKELLFATFDPLGAAAAGLPVAGLEYLLLVLLGMTIIVSIQAVGIILVVAMLVTPAATAQLLVVRFDSMMRMAVAMAVASAVIGLYMSFYLDLASGASIVLVETAGFLLALGLGPKTGLTRIVGRGEARGAVRRRDERQPPSPEADPTEPR
jgi:manganese/iron transport system permease protein